MFAVMLLTAIGGCLFDDYADAPSRSGSFGLRTSPSSAGCRGWANTSMNRCRLFDMVQHSQATDETVHSIYNLSALNSADFAA